MANPCGICDADDNREMILFCDGQTLICYDCLDCVNYWLVYALYRKYMDKDLADCAWHEAKSRFDADIDAGKIHFYRR